MIRPVLPFLLAFAAVCGLAPQVKAQGRRWQVRPGDALGLVAHRFGVTVEQLRRWNELDGDTIYVGQELVVGEEQDAAPAPDGTYVVAEGDTLSGLAARFNVSVDAICGWNDELDPDRIHVGQELRLGPQRRRVDYRVRRGDSLSRIAAHFGVRMPELLRWNSRLRRDRPVRIGQDVVVYTDRPLSESQAIGSAGAGRLERGVRLRRHSGFLIRDRERAWGTEETVSWLVDAVEAVREQHGSDARIRVHDISNRRGGYMAGHVSHQNGRDADLSLYQRRCGGAPCPMRRLTPDDIDAERQWTFFHDILKKGRADAIFLDYELQAPLYRQARATGATREQLHRWFQYPRGRSFPLGIIRHYPQHRDHAHVRFVCHESDEECR